MRRKILLVCLDGCCPEYIRAANTPVLDALAREGFYTEGSSVVPSVTNVNNVSILTGSFPRDHGITSNYWYDRRTGNGRYMETADFLTNTTVLERAAAKGLTTALVTSKKKLLHLLNRGAGYAVSAEDPPEDLVAQLGDPGGIYSSTINVWLLRAARIVLRELDPDVMYVSTTDYVQHKYPPEHIEARRHIEAMDQVLGEIVADNPEREIYITADHGMRDMTVGFDPARYLETVGVKGTFVPIIKDKYTVHHNNLGGAGYLYFSEPDDIERAAEALLSASEVEEIHTRQQAVERYNLKADRIGDLFILGTPGVVFGTFDAVREPVCVRSHGSRHESTVPIYAYNASVPVDQFAYNIDIVRHLAF